MSDNFKKYEFQLADIRFCKLNVLQIKINEFLSPNITLNFQPPCHGNASFKKKKKKKKTPLYRYCEKNDFE